MMSATQFTVVLFSWLFSLALTGSGNANASKCPHRSPNGTLEKVPGDNGFYLEIVGKPKNYHPGATYTVKLAGVRHQLPDGEVIEEKLFSHFVLVSENDDIRLQSNPSSAGNFQLLGDVRTKFSDHCPNTVTETSTLPKNEIQVLWTAPPDNSGCIDFKAMVVENSRVWAMDSGRLILTLCEERHPEEEINHIIDPCCACTEAKYEIMFQGLWSKETHPKDFPLSEWLLHFSDVIGASHSADYRVWEAGGLSSKGLSQVAKWGSPRVLESELKAKSSHIRTIIKSRGLWYPNVNGKTFAIFRTDPRNHLVSIVSMLGPSPDWIVGISATELCMANCTWLEKKEIPLYPWDAGVDDGISYESPDSPTTPQEPIRRITTSFPANPLSPFYNEAGGSMLPVAKLTIQKLREYKKECSAMDSRDQSQFVQPFQAVDGDYEQISSECAVSQWSVWSTCSVTCGKGISSRSREYLDAARSETAGCAIQLIQREMCAASVAVCDGDSNFYQSAPVDWTPDDMCATTEWSSWSECSSNCGEGFRIRTRRFYNRLGRKQCPHVETIMKEGCKVDRVCTPDMIEVIDPNCAVTDWSLWSPCSVSCGSGIKVRTRLYRVTREQQLTNGCSVQLMQKDTCTADRPTCEWGDAIAICQQEKETGPCRGNFVRWYYNSIVGACQKFNFGGCRGNSNNFLAREDCEKLCLEQDRDIADDPSAYQRSDDFLEALDVLARARQDQEGEGRNEVFREIEQQRMEVEKLLEERSSIGDNSRLDARIESAQKKLMMMEKQVMMKTQMEAFQMKQAMMKAGATPPPPVHVRPAVSNSTFHLPEVCEVTAWSPWSAQCSSSCGRGYRHRFRTISRPGKTCNRHLNRKRKCRLPPCPKECQVTEWGAWGPCSRSCGSDGSQDRHRQVISGTSCPSTVERRVCLLACCPGEPDCT